MYKVTTYMVVEASIMTVVLSVHIAHVVHTGDSYIQYPLSQYTLGSAVNLLGQRWILWFALHLHVALGSVVVNWIVILPKGSGG